MKAGLLALLLAAASASASARPALIEDNPSGPVEAPPSGLRDLTTGRYELVLSGVLCSACLRGAARELAEDRAVASAEPDFDHDQVIVVVKPGKMLKAAALKRRLARAAERVNLGATYEVAAVHYSLTPLTPAVPPKPASPAPKR